MKLKIELHQQCVAAGLCPRQRLPASDVKCIDGKAGNYDCNNVDLLSFVPIADMSNSNNDSNRYSTEHLDLFPSTVETVYRVDVCPT